MIAETGTGAFFARQDHGRHAVKDIVEVRAGRFSGLTPAPLNEPHPKPLAPAGDRHFHALLAAGKRVSYFNYGKRSWSAATGIGEFGTPGLFLIDDASIQLASDGRKQALAVWPKREGRLVGRWIELTGFAH